MTAPNFMVVDDDPALLDIMSAILGSLGCSSKTFADGPSALAALKDAPNSKGFNAIFLDIMMPEMDGLQVLKKIKENESTSEIPVIMLTAKSGYDEILDGYNVGADYYLTKPITKDQLVYAINLVLTPEEGSEATQTSWRLPEA